MVKIIFFSAVLSSLKAGEAFGEVYSEVWAAVWPRGFEAGAQSSLCAVIYVGIVLW